MGKTGYYVRKLNFCYRGNLATKLVTSWYVRCMIKQNRTGAACNHVLYEFSDKDRELKCWLSVNLKSFDQPSPEIFPCYLKKHSLNTSISFLCFVRIEKKPRWNSLFCSWSTKNSPTLIFNFCIIFAFLLILG